MPAGQLRVDFASSPTRSPSHGASSSPASGRSSISTRSGTCTATRTSAASSPTSTCSPPRCSCSCSAQLPAHLPGLGRRGPVLVPAHLVLVRARHRGGRGQEGVRHQPGRRLRVHARDVLDHREVRNARLRRDRPRGVSHDERDRHRGRAAAVPRRDRQERPDPAVPLAARRDGGPDAGLGAHPRRDDGHRRRVPRRVGPTPSSTRQQPRRCTVVAWVGAVTALVRGDRRRVQTDIKRVLAYSTISQLGYMFLAVGVGGVHRRDLPRRRARLLQGAACSSVPARSSTARPTSRTCARWAACAGTCPSRRSACSSSAGSPSRASSRSPASGRRTWIIESAFLHHSYAVWALGLLAAAMTGVYMTRLVYLTFYGNERFRADPARPAVSRGSDDDGDEADVEAQLGYDPDFHPTVVYGEPPRPPRLHGHDPHESPWQMTVPIVVLAALAVVRRPARPPAAPRRLARHVAGAGVPPRARARTGHLRPAAGALVAVSFVFAAVGIAIAVALYRRGLAPTRRRPARRATRRSREPGRSRLSLRRGGLRRGGRPGRGRPPTSSTATSTRRSSTER